jgi:hypothetical protein
MITQEYRENRARFSWADLMKYQGQWVAFSLDGKKIIASDQDLGKLDSLLIAAGENPENVALERIESDDCFLGGAELH